MVQQSISSLQKVVLAFSGVFTIAIFLPTIIAISTGVVSPYVPFISEGGGKFPEAGIFSAGLVMASALSEVIIFLRFLVVKEKCAKKPTGVHVILNNMSAILGTMSAIFLVLVAAFPTTTVIQLHNTAAGMACIGLVLYMLCHAWISAILFPEESVTKIRIALSVFSTLAMLTSAIFGVLGSTYWTTTKWTGKKTPQDEGFLFYTISATAEWSLAIMFLLFFSTFYSEMKKSAMCITFKMEAPNASKNPTIVVNQK